MRDWLARRSRRKKRQEARRQRLVDEYSARLAERDPEALATSRDLSDTDGVPWRTEVLLGALALAAIVVYGVVLLLDHVI